VGRCMGGRWVGEWIRLCRVDTSQTLQNIWIRFFVMSSASPWLGQVRWWAKSPEGFWIPCNNPQ
jgi:hypothetical protein